MNKLTILTTLVLLLGLARATAQVEYPSSVNFESTGQSLFDSIPATVLQDTFYMLKDNGRSGSFFPDPIDINAMIQDPNLGPTGFQILMKYGINFDMYSRYYVNSGSADIDYPVDVKFTVPNDYQYGCSQEMTIKTSFAERPGFVMKIEEPQAEFAIGAELGSGFFGGARGCFAGNCDEAGEDYGNPTFYPANASNFEQYLLNDHYDFLRISTNDGIQFPWDLNSSIPSPPGVPSLSLPFYTSTVPPIEQVAKIKGFVDNPVRNLDQADTPIPGGYKDAGSYNFMRMEFDPLQYQQYITGVPLSFNLNLGIIHIDFDIISVPLIYKTNLVHEFKFEPKVYTDLNLGQPMPWKEMNGSTVVKSGNSQIINDFKLGNDLKLVLPDNNPTQISPVLKLQNRFSTSLKFNGVFSIAFRIMHGRIVVDDLYDKPFALLNEEIEISNSTIPVLEKSFEMGGFDKQYLAPIQLNPDHTPPTLTTRNITVYIPDAGGAVSINPQDVVLSASDLHGGAIRYLSVTPNTFDCSKLGSNTVLVTIDDSRCNETSAYATVTVVDRTKPLVTCKPHTIYLNEQGSAEVNPADVFATGWDNCGSVSPISVSKRFFSCDNIGSNNTTTLTVTDGHNNFNTCVATITVIDNIPPKVSCKPFTAYLNEQGQSSVLLSNILESGTDNCAVVNYTTNFPIHYNCNDLGARSIVLNANDGHGNTASCSAVVTVVDAIPPTVTCKYKVEAVLNANGQASIVPADVFQSGADNCGIVNLQSVVPSTFNCSNLGANVVVLTVNDGHGNTGTCSMNTLSVVDIMLPTVLCRNITLPLDDQGKATLLPEQINNGSYDNCSMDAYWLSKNQFTCENIGQNIVILTGRDQSHNENHCTSTVTVVDNQAPITLCKSYNANLGADGKVRVLPTHIDAGSRDNCSLALSVDAPEFDCEDIGEHVVTLKAIDGSGNERSCTAVVTVADRMPAVARCAEPRIYLDDTGHADIEPWQVDNGTQDNCGGALNISLSQTSFNCSEIPGSAWPVTMYVEDAHGNQSQCYTHVFVLDTFAPTAICYNTTVHLNADGTVTVYPDQLAYDSYDNCSVWAYDPVAEVYTTRNIGVNRLTITVKDWSGNESTCVSEITVKPHQPSRPSGSDRDASGQETVNVVLYPNPASGETNLKVNLDADQSCMIRAFDASGRLVFQRESLGLKGENVIPITLQGVAPGVYLIEFTAGNTKKVERLIVND